jgi:hypothetical protein
MRLRKWTAIVALLGVLLHAGTLVRHHGIMLSAQLLEQALASGLAAICHGDESAASDARAGLPGGPNPSKSPGDCPVCAGHAPVFAVAAPDRLATPVRFAVMARWCEPERTHPALRHAVCPPARGPPLSGEPA